MKQARLMVLSMRPPVESGRRLKRIANRHGWTLSDASTIQPILSAISRMPRSCTSGHCGCELCARFDLSN
jgi:hypothetical protein